MLFASASWSRSCSAASPASSLARPPLDFHVTTRTSSSPTSTTCCSAASCSRLRRDLLLVARSAPAGCSTSASGKATSGLRSSASTSRSSCSTGSASRACPAASRLPARATASRRYNRISTIGAFLLGASTMPFLWNIWLYGGGEQVTVDDPWGTGRSLEWATSCPPPRHNFTSLPRIRSESPRLRPAPPRARPNPPGLAPGRQLPAGRLRRSRARRRPRHPRVPIDPQQTQLTGRTSRAGPAQVTSHGHQGSLPDRGGLRDSHRPSTTRPICPKRGR